MSVLGIDFIKEEIQPLRIDGMIAIHFSGFDRETGSPKSSGYLFSEVELRTEGFIESFAGRLSKRYGPKLIP